MREFLKAVGTYCAVFWLLLWALIETEISWQRRRVEMDEPKPMRCYLTGEKRAPGEKMLFTLTGLKPIIMLVMGTERQAVYIRPSDPFGVRHLCADVVEPALGFRPDPLEVVEVELSIRLIARHQ